MKLSRGRMDRARLLRGLEWLVWLVLLGAYFWRFSALHRAVPSARVFHDTQLYFSAAQNGFFSAGIWAGERSPLPLLVFKWCHTDPEQIRQFLLVSSAACWLALAAAVLRRARSPVVRVVGASLVLSLALSRDIAHWNEVILSESLSFSSGALCVAAGLMFLQKPHVWFAPLVLTAALFGLCRDSNAYLILCLGLLAGAAALYQGVRRKGFVLTALVGIGFVAIFFASNASSNRGGRWEYPLTNVIVSRVLPKPAAVEQMAALGMPTSPALRAGRPRRSYGSDPRLAGFRDWLGAHGKRAYIRYLLANPGYAASRPVAEAPALLGENLAQYSPKGIEAAGEWLSDVLWWRAGWWLRLVALPALCGFLLFRQRGSLSAFAWVGVVLSVLVYPHALVVWHGDAMEVPRHGLQVAFQVELALLCLTLAALDEVLLLVGRRARSDVASSPNPVLE